MKRSLSRCVSERPARVWLLFARGGSSLGWTLFVVLVATAIGGCERNVYQLELTPQEDALQRKLTVHRQRTAKDQPAVVAMRAEELERIASAHGQTLSKQQMQAQIKHTFLSRFVDQMPDDVGGRGSYTHWQTSLGSTTAYVERYRGRDDPAEAIMERQVAVDDAVRHLLAWVDFDLQDDRHLPQIRRYLDQQFRSDLKNLSVYAWLYTVVPAGDPKGREELTLRLGQYLAERDYISAGSLPALVRELRSEDDLRAFKALRPLIMTKLQLDEPLSAKLAELLKDPRNIADSFDAYAKTTDEYQNRLKQWEAARPQAPELNPPNPADILFEPLAAAFLPAMSLILSPDELNVTLATPAPPFMTNGQWDARARTVSWSRSLEASDAEARQWPAFAYAIWSEPNRGAQEKHFGKVLLDEAELAQYCFWRRALTIEEGRLWDEFLSTLRPGDGLVEALESFRFPAETDSRDPWMSAIRELFVATLKGT